MAKTKEFWEQLASYEVAISAMTSAELASHPDEAEALADEYLGREVFPRAARADAVHVAVATVHGAGILVSWNFRHMVKLRTRQLLAAINPLLGYPVIQIVSPLEI